MPGSITSTANPLVKELAKLSTRRGRDRAGRFLIEGHREIELAHAAGIVIEHVLVAPDHADGSTPALAVELGEAGARITELGPAPSAKLSVRRHPAGIIAVGVTPHSDLASLDLGPDLLVLVAEAIEKPGNLGAMARTADGVGVAALVVADPTVDLVNPNVIRASQGAIFSVPTAVGATTDVVAWARRHSIRMVAASPDASTALWDADLTGPLAVAIGAEDRGVSPPMRDAADLVAIPMAGAADSLNASVAAAVVLYEARRQRLHRGD